VADVEPTRMWLEWHASGHAPQAHQWVTDGTTGVGPEWDIPGIAPQPHQWGIDGITCMEQQCSIRDLHNNDTSTSLLE